jgi:hypothetical protein
MPVAYIKTMTTPSLAPPLKLSRTNWLFLALPVALSTLMCMVVHAWWNHRHAGESVFGLANLVGPTAYSLINHGDLYVNLGPMGFEGIGANGARMPLVPALVAALTLILGTDDILPIGFAKILLTQLPVAVTSYIVFRRTPPSKRILGSLILLLPFLSTPVMANVVSMQVEEGWAYGLIALTFAMLAFGHQPETGDATHTPPPWHHALGFAFAVCLIYLTKSSYVLFCVGLCAGYAWVNRRGLAHALLPLAALCLTLGAWGTYQLKESGRFHIGTSLDGINLHKGNNAQFLDRYPPAPGSNLDEFDKELNKGQVFTNEWAFDSFHKERAAAFIKQNPAATAEAFGRKAYQYFFSLQKIGSSDATGWRSYWEQASLVLFRAANLGAMAWALFGLFFGRIGRAKWSIALLYLGTCALVAAPYLIGFAYTRHASVLFIPTAIFFIYLITTLPDAPRTRPVK